MRLYWELARRALQRRLVYRTENLAGLFTNVFFGYLRAALLAALFAATPDVAGYDVQAAITYSWITQALIMVVGMWGWWDVEQTIRTGDVITDLARPVPYVAFWLARDFGRAAYYVAFRAAPVLIGGQVLFGLHWPSSLGAWAAFSTSLVLGVLVSFGWRFLLNLSAFWTTDARGLGALGVALALFAGGFVVPVRFFPDWLQVAALALPFAAFVQIPADLFVERIQGWAALGALGLQALWVVILLGAAQWVTLLATRRVVIQGG